MLKKKKKSGRVQTQPINLQRAEAKVGSVLSGHVRVGSEPPAAEVYIARPDGQERSGGGCDERGMAPLAVLNGECNALGVPSDAVETNHQVVRHDSNAANRQLRADFVHLGSAVDSKLGGVLDRLACILSLQQNTLAEAGRVRQVGNSGSVLVDTTPPHLDDVFAYVVKSRVELQGDLPGKCLRNPETIWKKSKEGTAGKHLLAPWKRFVTALRLEFGERTRVNITSAVICAVLEGIVKSESDAKNCL